MRKKMLNQLAQTIKKHGYSDGTTTAINTDQLYLYIIANLSEQERKIYDFMVEWKYGIDSGSISRIFKIEHNHASSVLKILFELNLLRRERKSVDGISKFFYWAINYSRG